MTTAILARSSLRSAVTTACLLVARRNTVPVLANVMVAKHPAGGAMVRSTDCDMQATIRLPDAAVDEGFATTIPAHNLKEIEGKAPIAEFVTVDVAGGEKDAVVNSLDFEGLRIRVNGIAARKFPKLEIEGHINAEFELPSATLLAGLEAVRLAVSTEETRYYLNGVYMHPIPGGGGLRLVATDGHRLAHHDIAVDNAGTGWGAIVPRGAVDFLLRVLKGKAVDPAARIVVNTVKAMVTVGNLELITGLVDGTFPDYGRVMPTYSPNVATVDRVALIAGIKAVSAIASARGRAVRFDFNHERVQLGVSNPELGNAEMDVPCTLAGEPMAIGFNGAYMLDILNAMDGDTVCIGMSDSGSPARLEEPNGATIYVQMPMRV